MNSILNKYILDVVRSTSIDDLFIVHRFLDIKFNPRLLRIPHILIDNVTIHVLLNSISFE